MLIKRAFRAFFTLLAAVPALLVTPGSAQTPSNDECTGALTISALPYTVSQNTRLATANATDPDLICADGGGGKSVWFVYTPAATGFVKFSTVGSTPAEYDIAMGILTGSCGTLTLIGCSDDVEAGIIRQSEIIIRLMAGVTYYIHVAEWNGGGSTGGTPTGGDLVFTAQESGPPPLAKGPKAGSVPAGVTRSTDPFGASAPVVDPTPRTMPNKPPVTPIPDERNTVKATAPEGANYTEHSLQKPAAMASLPIPFKDFPGIPDEGTRIPPDPDLAVGPNHVIAVVNSRFRIWDKEGTILKTIQASQWFSNLSPGAWNPFDPQVVFDHHANRWVMTWAHVQDTTSATILITVSDDADPLGTWYSWALPSNALGDSTIQLWDDYPQTGYDAEAIYIAGRMFFLSGVGRPYCRIKIIPKTQLYANNAGPLSWFDLWDIRDPSSTDVAPDNIQSSVVFGTPGVQFLMAASPFVTGTYFSVWRVTNPTTDPSISGFTVPVTAYTTPPNAGQLGGGSPLIDGGGRALRHQPVYRDSSLWAAHNIASGTGGAYSAVRYIRVNPFTGALLEDAATGTAGFWHHWTSLAVDKDRNVLVTFSRSGETEYAGAYVAGRKDGDTPGLSQAVALRPGEANYVKTFGGTRNRWGDYSGAALDPADGASIWVHTEYAASPANTWGNWIGQYRIGPLPGAYAFADRPTLRFPRREVGTAGDTLSVTITNAGQDNLVISSLIAPAANFALANPPALPLVVPSLGSTTLQVFSAPTVEGDVVDSLGIVSNDAINGTLRIRLEGRGVVIAAAQPGIMYATSGAPSLKLFTVSRATGSATAVGEYPVKELQGLTVRPLTNELFGVSTSDAGTTLYRVSAANGEALQAQQFGVPGMRAIAFSAADELYGATIGGRLYRLGLATGDTTFVGSASGIAYSSLAFSPTSGMLWGSVRPTLAGRDRIYTVNPATGAATLVGSTGRGVITPSITFDAAGRLYALLGTATTVNELHTLDTMTATASLIGSLGVSGVLAIAMRPDSLVTDVPGEPGAEVPGSFALHQNHPNPFNPSTVIEYQLPTASRVTLGIYSMLGQEIARLVDADRPAGYHSAVWDGRTSSGVPAATGVYLYRLEATASTAAGGSSAFVETRKMLLVK